jgi:hypothetical protein
MCLTFLFFIFIFFWLALGPPSLRRRFCGLGKLQQTTTPRKSEARLGGGRGEGHPDDHN